eukprot:CAMPEP_0170174584 /NCGR_PEP_ID=MMETSP0040_2-20121228/7800_1 /TAXON_ID=641309 /ORGANISM="Lotharella oceanica, Strain CCMP622" /LENGTH=292 /DNA_ID=CAMNT_0010416281 /DNA_START=45 /DNA_END=923 /DNA_ORIENTATION=+
MERKARVSLTSYVIVAVVLAALFVGFSGESRLQQAPVTPKNLQKTPGGACSTSDMLPKRNMMKALGSALLLGAAKPAISREVLFESAQPAPVLCTRPRPGSGRPLGIIDVDKTDVYERVRCTIGGYTISDTKYEFEAPDIFQPLTGFFAGGPDPAGTLDMRLETMKYGGNRPVTIVISNGKGNDEPKSRPWTGKKSITDLGNPDQFLKVFAPQLVVNEKIATVEEKDGIVYYKYVLYKAAANYNNRKVISAAIYNGDLICIVGLASDSNWDKAKPVLLNVIDSFRVIPNKEA